MHRTVIHWSRPPSGVRRRTAAAALAAEAELPAGSPPDLRPHQFPKADSPPSAPPAPDIAPLLESLAGTLDAMEGRRQQSLAEMQQVALELAIAVASNLVFEAISTDHFAVEELVRATIDQLGLGAAPVVALHPADLELLQRRLADEPPPWRDEQIVLQPDSTVARGGCRAEASNGTVLVSDISLRLSDIRRHWMEELDDAQVERRRTQGHSQSLRRFPDRRETA